MRAKLHLFFSTGIRLAPSPSRYLLESGDEHQAHAEMEAALLGGLHLKATADNAPPEAAPWVMRPIFTEDHSAEHRSALDERYQNSFSHMAFEWMPLEVPSNNLSAAMATVAEEVALAMHAGHQVGLGLTEGLRPLAVGMSLGYALGLLGNLQPEGAGPKQESLVFAAFSHTPNRGTLQIRKLENLAPTLHLLGLSLGARAHRDGLGPEWLTAEMESLLVPMRRRYMRNAELKAQGLPPWVLATEALLKLLRRRHLASLAMDPKAWWSAQTEITKRLTGTDLQAAPHQGHASFESLHGAAQLLRLALATEKTPLNDTEVDGHLVVQAWKAGWVAPLVARAYAAHETDPSLPLSPEAKALRNHVEHMGVGKADPCSLNQRQSQLGAWLAQSLEPGTWPPPPEMPPKLGRRILIAPMGDAPQYEHLTHLSSNGKQLGQGRFALVAAAKEAGGHWDELWVTLPTEAHENKLWGHWEALEHACAEAGLPPPQALPIDNENGTSWRFFDLILARARAGDRLHLDLTHSFRHLPLAAWMVGAYAQASGQGAQLEGLHYVFFNPKEPGLGRCLKLNAGLEALELARALAAWRHWGQGEALGDWLRQLLVQSDCSPTESEAWQTLSEHVPRLGKAFKWAHWGALEESLESCQRATENLTALAANSGLALPWHRLLLSGLEESLAKLAPTSKHLPVRRDPQRLENLARLSYAQHDWFTAALLWREAKFCAEALPLGLSDEQHLEWERFVGQHLKRDPKEDPDEDSHTQPTSWPKPSDAFLNQAKAVGHWRNQIAHLRNNDLPPEAKRDKLAAALKAHSAK